MIRMSMSAFYRPLWLGVICLTAVSCSTPPGPEPAVSKLDPEPAVVSPRPESVEPNTPEPAPVLDNLRSALERNVSVETIDRLLKNGATVADSDLLYVIMSGLDPKIVTLLRVNGATLNRDDWVLLTRKLGSVIGSGQADPNYVGLLLDNGADPNE